MKMKKIIGILLLGFMAVILVACGQKSAEEMIKTELKDSYTGYSKNPGYENPFNEGDDTLKFNKEERSITNSQGKKKYFAVLSEKDVPSDTKRVLKELEGDLKGTDNFTIIISREKNPTKKQSEATYQIALSDGGKTIRIFELRRNERDYGYYDFTGQAD
ncbi:hypothetical protein StDouc24_02840 [Streptococcus thermophilus]|uniref:LptM family lipoprotein n=1 Tax=Streptococcus thermophilus TaxID=1308 RepID=UPI001C6492A2|nr:hypothetical protein [Streptococcus thermophilus]MBW7797520.1 hypothetical protein [Streptococcus thermophilus]